MNTRRQLWKFCIPCVATIVLGCFSEAGAQVRYKVTDLGVVNGNNLGMPMGLNNQGWTVTMDQLLDPISLSLSATAVSGSVRITIGERNIGLPTLGGANTSINWGGINDRGEAVGLSETSVPDPDGEDLCGFGTGKTCLPFLWRDGHMSALPTLGGNNGQASAINNRGQITGFAETGDADAACPFPSKTDSAVLWDKGQAQALPTVGGDPDGTAFGINDRGQAVGYTGTCTTASHAVLWENGTAIQLHDNGVSRSNVAYAINNQGQIVGRTRTADGSTSIATLWENNTPISLGILPGDFASWALSINNRRQVVGTTFTLDSNFTLNWSRGFIWQDKVMTDLNTLIPADSNLFIVEAGNINERGQIAGMAVVQSGPHKGDVHGFLLTPVEARIGESMADVANAQGKPNLPANTQRKGGFRPGRSEQ